MRHWWCLPLTLVAFLTGCDEIRPNYPVAERRDAAVRLAQARSLKRACGSQQTFERLKAIAFDEAARVRRADSPELRRLAGVSVARMEDPVATTRDEGLGLTVCSGRLVVELPPGAQDVFDGDRRLEANVEYVAQRPAHGDGFVYRMQGAEPIIYRLAAFDLPGRLAGRVPTEPVALASTDPRPAAVPPEPVPGPVRSPVEAAVRYPAPSKPTSTSTKRTQRPEPPARMAEARRERPRTVKTAAVKKPRTAKPKLQAQARRERSRATARVAPSQVALAAKRTARSAARAKPPVKVAKASRERPVSLKLVRRTARAASSAKPVRVAAIAAKRSEPPIKTSRAARPVPRSAPPARVAEVRRAQPRPAARLVDGCARARGSVGRLVCSDPRLSRADRREGATLYAALADADPETRAELRRSGARFLAYRDRCPSAGCVAQAYADRIEEIRDIASGDY